jgi:CDP-diacylglycerol--serine O-phosphatidyltransferase
MVSEIRYYSFKEIRFHHRHPFPVLLALILVIMFTIASPEPMLFLGITVYALSGPVTLAVRLLTGRRRPPAAAASPSGEVRRA